MCLEDVSVPSIAAISEKSNFPMSPRISKISALGISHSFHSFMYYADIKRPDVLSDAQRI